MNNRYAGNPFLKLLESYVLDAMGQLDETEAETLQRMAPKLAQTYDTQGTWQQIVAHQMGFPNTLPAKIRGTWDAQAERSRAQGTRLVAAEFAIAFVDHYFPKIAHPDE